MRTLSSSVAMVALGILAGCSSKMDATEDNFAAALNQYFEQKGTICVSTGSWPVEVSPFEQTFLQRTKNSKAGQMLALEAAGLAKEVSPDPGSKSKGKNYALTEAAQPFIQERVSRAAAFFDPKNGKQIDLCWGKKSLDQIIKWEGPIKLGDYQEASVTYTYDLVDVAEWAKKTDIQEAFPIIKSTMDGAGSSKASHGIKLTSEGWEARGLE